MPYRHKKWCLRTCANAPNIFKLTLHAVILKIQQLQIYSKIENLTILFCITCWAFLFA